ncbi:MAG: ankyrin repeat domain-containing protein [Desertifilum sp.]|nr:ankyrin repeat domain-containing protein [Desertifilum sp.]
MDIAFGLLKQRYQLLSPLGEGSSITYTAFDRQCDRQVAIKVLSLNAIANWKPLEQFEREAQILAKLQHPAIPTYLDYFWVDTPETRHFFIVQQLAEGQSLFELVSSGWRTTELEVRNIAIQVLEILAYLHQLKPPVIHGDLKPHNLIRRNDGNIYLVDFGAVQQSYPHARTHKHTVVGTFGYMAPEQFWGKPTPASDLYSLGATLLFLLTRRSPAELPVEDLKLDFRPSIYVSDFFAGWLERMLEPDATKRFSCAQSALKALKYESPYPVKTASKTRKKSSLLLAAFAVILLAVLNQYKYSILSSFRIYPIEVFEAAQTGDITTVQYYIEKGVNPNAHYWKRYCLDRQSPEWIELSCEDWAYLRRNSFPSHSGSFSLLGMAGSQEVAEFLIAKGSDINIRNYFDETPIYSIIGFIIHEKKIDREEGIKILKVLIQNKVDINIQDEAGITPISWAISSDEYSYKIVDLLIKNSANVNVKARNGATPLHFAVFFKNTDIIDLLITNGANINAQDIKGETPLHKTYKSYAPAQYKGRYDTERMQLLLDRGANINLPDNNGKTLIHYASADGAVKIIELLIANGADITLRDNTGKTPLELAGDLQTIGLLKKHSLIQNTQ